MKLTGNFTKKKYESEIRPTMTIGNPQSLVQSDNLSGLMMWDRDALINIVSRNYCQLGCVAVSSSMELADC